MNTIKIELTLENRKKDYFIYVTKTDMPDTANTNLETLAVEGAYLTPDFGNDYSYFTCELSNDVDNLNVLAIPQNMNAKVEVTGNNYLQIGDNQIVIKVIAENGYSFRRFYINAYRRNKTEQTEFEDNQNYQIQRISTLLDSDIKTDLPNKTINNKNKNTNMFIYVLFFIAIFTVIIAFAWSKIKK